MAVVVTGMIGKLDFLPGWEDLRWWMTWRASSV